MNFKTLSLTVFAAALFLTTGCETVKGIGRDAQDAGEWVEKTAEDND